MLKDNTDTEIYVVEYYVNYRGWQSWKGFWFGTPENALAAARSHFGENVEMRVAKFTRTP